MATNKDFRVKNGLVVEQDANVTGTVTAAHFVGDGSGLSGVTSYTAIDFASDLATKDTDDLTEGSTNLYYTDARFDTRLGLKTTDDVDEGSLNLYYTTTRANTDFDSRLSLKSTSDLTEGTNLYYTDVRVGSYLTANSYATQSYVNTAISNLIDAAPTTLDTLNELAAALGDDANFATTVSTSLSNKFNTSDFNSTFDTRLATKSTTNLSEGANLYYTTSRANSDFDARLQLKTTTDLAEGTNQYFTTSRARNSISAGSGVNYDPVTGEISVSSSGTTVVNNITTTGDASISGNVTIGGNLTVSGSTTTVSAVNMAIADNMVYMNNGAQSTITNATGNGTTQTYTTAIDHNYSVGMVVSVFSVNPTGYNVTNQTITAVTSTTFSIAGSFTTAYVSGGSARAKSGVNPDVGFAAGYNDGTYHHAGFFRDATDGYWKVFQNYAPEPDNSIYIDTSDATFQLADIQAANFRGALVGNADTATKLATARTITLAGDLSGSVSIDGSANVTLTATVAANSVALGTDTTGNYMIDVTAGGGITLSHTQSEGSTATISHADTSSVANLSSDNANGVVIQDVALAFDTYGHVQTASVATVDLDGRYSQLGHTHSYLAGNSHVVRDLNALIQSTVLDGELHYHAYSQGSTGGVGMTDNANGVITVGQHNGGYNAQLSFSSDGHLYWRESIAGGTPTDWQKIWKDGSDGSGSGLDADLLDGQHGSYYLDWTNVTNKPDPVVTVTLTGDVTGTANTTLTDLASGTISITTTVVDDSHSHNYIPINPDGDGAAWSYSDENPTINGVGIGGGQRFGADGSPFEGFLQAKIVNAYNGFVNSANGYYVGNYDFGATTNTYNTTRVIDGSGNITAASVTASGNIVPSANATYDLGTTSTAWRNIYTNDLHLSNMEHEEGNSVDGTKGNWTVQEGEECLYIINNRNGKKYKFVLQEV